MEQLACDTAIVLLHSLVEMTYPLDSTGEMLHVYM